MKNIAQLKWILLFCVGTIFAQQEKGIFGTSNWLNNWTEFKPTKAEYGEPNQILAGNISTNTVLYKKNVYSLQGNVYVTNNAQLKIEPGTVILCDAESKATLVITKGASIIAEGNETDAIVFTSNKDLRKAGDWGGIVILGDAPINKFGNSAAITSADLDPTYTLYGGSNSASSSGVLKYVRIEFAGKKLKGQSFFSGLTLAGVGNKTVVDNVMTSYSAGDGLSVLGGEPMLSKMVSYRCSGVDFKFSYGTQAKIDNSLAVRSSFVTSSSGGRCLDVSSYERKEEVDFSKKQTSVMASNLTLVNDSDNFSVDVKSGLIKEAILVAENCNLSLKKTVLSGFGVGVMLDEKIELVQNNLNKIKLEETFFNFCKNNVTTTANAGTDELESWYGHPSFLNVYSNTDNADTFVAFSDQKRPDFRLAIAKITASSK